MIGTENQKPFDVSSRALRAKETQKVVDTKGRIKTVTAKPRVTVIENMPGPPINTMRRRIVWASTQDF